MRSILVASSTLLAAIATRIGDRMAALYDVIAGAAGSTPRSRTCTGASSEPATPTNVVSHGRCHARVHLRSGLSEAHATDIMWAIANPNTHRRLVAERRWTGDEYERWLAHALTCSLLETESAR